MDLDELRTVQSKERRKDSLQHLRTSFYDDVADYVRGRKAERDRRAERVENPFSDAEVRRLSDEIETAEEVAEAVYERRVGKVVKLASFAAAEMPVDEEGLTDRERELFEDLVDRIDENKSRVLDVLAGERSDDEAEAGAGAPTAPADAIEDGGGADASAGDGGVLADAMGEGGDVGDAGPGDGEGQSQRKSEISASPETHRVSEDSSSNRKPKASGGGETPSESQAAGATGSDDGEASEGASGSRTGSDDSEAQSASSSRGSQTSGEYAPGDDRVGGADPADAPDAPPSPPAETDADDPAAGAGDVRETPKESHEPTGTEGSGDREARSASGNRKPSASGDSAERSSASSQNASHSGDREASEDASSSRDAERPGDGDGGRTTVRITRDVGAIFGVDEREYDLADEDVVSLPDANADPLIERGAAERLD